MSMKLRQAYEYLLGEPLWWIFLAFFQPARFSREIEISGRRFWRRIIPMLRLALPMILVAYPLGLIEHASLIPFHLLLHPDITSFLLEPAIGLVIGIAAGIALGIAVGIALGIVGGIASGIAFSITSGIASGIAFSITVDTISGIAGSIT